MKKRKRMMKQAEKRKKKQQQKTYPNQKERNFSVRCPGHEEMKWMLEKEEEKVRKN